MVGSLVGGSGPCSCFKVLRGGGWNNPAENLRAAYRNRNHASNRNDDIGFRVLAAPANMLTTRYHASPRVTMQEPPGRFNQRRNLRARPFQ